MTSRKYSKTVPYGIDFFFGREHLVVDDFFNENQMQIGQLEIDKRRNENQMQIGQLEIDKRRNENQMQIGQLEIDKRRNDMINK